MLLLLLVLLLLDCVRRCLWRGSAQRCRHAHVVAQCSPLLVGREPPLVVVLLVLVVLPHRVACVWRFGPPLGDPGALSMHGVKQQRDAQGCASSAPE